MSDLFQESINPFQIEAVFNVRERCPQHTFLVLTKRPQGMFEWQEKFLDFPYHNVHLGVSVENQEQADKRIPWLLKTPAMGRFLSVEPMLEKIGLWPFLNTIKVEKSPDNVFQHLEIPLIGQVIVGGESGPKARPMYPDWARSIRDECKKAGVAFFLKQMSGGKPIPEDLQIREYPKGQKIDKGRTYIN